jgi:hypothetical protein
MTQSQSAKVASSVGPLHVDHLRMQPDGKPRHVARRDDDGIVATILGINRGALPAAYAMLESPGRDEHLDNLRTTIRSIGQAGIPIVGYTPGDAGLLKPGAAIFIIAQ